MCKKHDDEEEDWTIGDTIMCLLLVGALVVPISIITWSVAVKALKGF